VVKFRNNFDHLLHQKHVAFNFCMLTNGEIIFILSVPMLKLAPSSAGAGVPSLTTNSYDNFTDYLTRELVLG